MDVLKIEREISGYGLKLCEKRTRITVRDRILVACHLGHIRETTLKNVRKTKKCVECSRLRPYFDFKDSLELEGYSVLTTEDEYIKTAIPLDLICPKGHSCKITKPHFDSGRRCPKCKPERIRLSKMIPVEEIRSMYEKDGYKVIDGFENYQNLHSTLLVQCPNGHRYRSLVTNFRSGYRCDSCFRKSYRGSNVHNWKGYNDKYVTMFRRFIKSWREESMGVDGKCILSGSSNVEIHHLYSFIDIVERFCLLNDLDLGDSTNDISKEQQYNLRNKFVAFHNSYGLGVCLDKELHILFHRIYGKKNNTPYQFEEFSTNYIEGKLYEF